MEPSNVISGTFVAAGEPSSANPVLVVAVIAIVLLLFKPTREFIIGLIGNSLRVITYMLACTGLGMAGAYSLMYARTGQAQVDSLALAIGGILGLISGLIISQKWGK